MHDPIVNGWLFLRYLIIGLYVGLVTVYGFVWWYIYFPQASGNHEAGPATCACMCELSVGGGTFPNLGASA